MTKLLTKEKPLQVLPSLALKIGLHQALVLQQVHYWLSRKKDVDADGIPWTYNTYEEWQKQFPWWGIENIRKLFRSLRDQGLLITDRRSVNRWDRTNHYTIDYEKLNQILTPTGMVAPEQSGAVVPEQSGTNVPHDYITTENTTENNSLDLAEPLATAEASKPETLKSLQAEPTPAPNPPLSPPDDMANAKDVLKQHEEKEVVPQNGVKGLALRWKQIMKSLNGGFEFELTKKEFGQLKQFRTKVGEDRAWLVLDYTMQHWAEFVWDVSKAKGSGDGPDQPLVGYLSTHADIALQLSAKAEAKANAPKPIPVKAKEPVKMFDKQPPIVHSSQAGMESGKDQPSQHDYEAAMAAFAAMQSNPEPKTK